MHEHRIAMALAPIAMLRPEIKIADPMVVNQSYPNFWEQLKEVGFNIEEN
ncbi:hypothetical protein [Ancylomarina sp. 16SWW S1-10-2]|nr:hypothetical protein [Ancylomarina sp. 16SWW S1-10-2]MRT91956.1 hypothetical protein [Ancylomarina sp. 16SWW S1-10-2]